MVLDLLLSLVESYWCSIVAFFSIRSVGHETRRAPVLRGSFGGARQK
jgi:hypothetical protein